MQVAFHFDVLCPWAYQTSKWIREVADHGEVSVDWRFFSLEEVNREEGKLHPWERPWSYGWSLLRVAALLRRDSADLVGRFYEAAGRALHEEGRKVHTPEGAREVAAEIRADPGVVDRALEDPTTNDEVLADHRRVIDAGGFGVPTLFLEDGTCLFGPVVTPAPTGREALRLWDLTAGWAELDHLYELRRPKSRADWEHIEASFQPYLQARSWQSVQKPVA